jgi:cyclophilin family peptidyl-prolyl cis-trans isomerase
MMKRLKSWLRFGRSERTANKRTQLIEPLEDRVLLSGGPRVLNIMPDNRGQVVITMDRALNPATVNTNSVKILIADSKGVFRAINDTVSYYAALNRITATAVVKANTVYRVLLYGTGTDAIKGADGSLLDGEFVAANKLSGNGVAGGNYYASTKTPASAVARFTSLFGAIDVKLFNVGTNATPYNVLDFLNYANNGKYDSTFIHRSVPGFVIQGGGYFVTSSNTVATISTYSYVTKNEAHANNPGNIRGTIAMAQVGTNADSASDQWFFNLADNRSNLDVQNGGFTVFGQIIGDAQSSLVFGLNVMDKIANLPIQQVGLQSPFDALPLFDYTSGAINPKKNLAIFSRIAMLVDIGAIPTGTTTAKAALAAQPLAATKAFSTTVIPADANLAAADSVLNKADASVLS